MKPLPQSNEAEMSVLGSILINNKSLSEIILEPRHFYKEAHRIIFNTIKNLEVEGLPIDTVTVVEKLQRLKLIDSVGGAYYIASLTEFIPSSANIKHYAEIVKTKYDYRKIIEDSQNLIKLSYDEIKEIEELKSIASQNIDDMRVRKAKIKTLNEVKDELIQEKQDHIDGKIKLIRTGYDMIDFKRGGFDREYVLLAGRPSIGKTTLAINWALNMAKSGIKVGFIPLESYSTRLCERVVKQELSGINLKNKEHLNDLKKHKLTENLIIDDSFGENIEEVEDSMRVMINKYKCEIIFIDYLQLIAGKAETRNIEISRISRSLVRFKKHNNISIVALSQLSRGDEFKEPELSSLRDSGSLEQDADIVVMLFCNPNEKQNTIREVKVSIKKYRDGALDSDIYKFHTEQSYFEDKKISYRDPSEAGF